MHVIFRESHGLEETQTPTDLGQSPADLVVLSFSDSDLGAFAAGWHQAKGLLPTLRLANIAALQHPLSVDTYVEQTLSQAKGILIRLIGGVPYWPYGLQQIEAMAREKGIALAVLPADGRPDARLDAVSTVPASTLHRLTHLCDTGGAAAAQAALAQMALAAGLYAGPVPGTKTLPDVGAWTPEDGITCPAPACFDTGAPLVLVVFYRSYLVAADLAPINALFAALRDRGFRVLGLFAPSLKAPGARDWLEGQTRRLARGHRQRDLLFRARRGRFGPRSTLPMCPCSKSPSRPRHDPPGQRLNAACRLPTSRCMSSCPKWTGGSSLAWLPSRNRARGMPTCNLPATPTHQRCIGFPPSPTVSRLGTGLPQLPLRTNTLRLCSPPTPGGTGAWLMRWGLMRWRQPRRSLRTCGPTATSSPMVLPCTKHFKHRPHPLAGCRL